MNSSPQEHIGKRWYIPFLDEDPSTCTTQQQRLITTLRRQADWLLRYTPDDWIPEKKQKLCQYNAAVTAGEIEWDLNKIHRICSYLLDGDTSMRSSQDEGTQQRKKLEGEWKMRLQRLLKQEIPIDDWREHLSYMFVGPPDCDNPKSHEKFWSLWDDIENPNVQEMLRHLGVPENGILRGIEEKCRKATSHRAAATH